MDGNQLLLWVGFNLFVLAMLALDLGVFHRQAHAVTIKEATVWSTVWIALALAFNVGVYLWRGPETALEFLTGYLIEKSLSVDNIFVFLMIFSYFSVPAALQHRVLFWGIIGALIMRGIFIAVGATLLAKFHWIIYVFGGFLVLTGIKMGVQKDTDIHPERNPVLRFFRQWMPITEGYDGEHFLVRRAGRLFATPLFLVLLMVETTDLIFALDSIPAIFAVTRDPFIVYTSNVFAILGLRSLFFLLAGIMGLFRYLKLGLAVVLVFVGVKMMIVEIYKIPIAASLGVVFGVLAISVLASVLIPHHTGKTEP
ncbi:TerC family protein [Caldinitratiruptor microaerophilus]|uniref:Membrane protein n=1 Tax=Caldinitratiruptor microaerophilus TaxID=671077 RepID=A0AA35CR98_9FIRM|nr:TerC family protein [Caldinitratiruptor microaerophilus]BDG62350.1 membrane protein [Caldinitratiruptor microaerophilus]